MRENLMSGSMRGGWGGVGSADAEPVAYSTQLTQLPTTVVVRPRN